MNKRIVNKGENINAIPVLLGGLHWEIESQLFEKTTFSLSQLDKNFTKNKKLLLKPRMETEYESKLNRYMNADEKKRLAMTNLAL
jgi:hypothetical protein